MAQLRFDNKVVLITGAGNGLGKACAFLFASRGAKIIVNDFSYPQSDDKQKHQLIDAIVNEIKQSGGVAIADYNSATNGEEIVQAALGNFGHVDILVNSNEKSQTITEYEWNIRLKGSFKTTQAAFLHMKKQSYGRIVTFLPEHGLHGNVADSKMALIGLSNVIGLEGASNNIHCNIIVPRFASKLDFLSPKLEPDVIASMVAYLCHESCTENGALIESELGWVEKSQLCKTNSALIEETIFNNTDANIAVNKFTYEIKDLILHALAIGMSAQEPEELKYLYQDHEDFTYHTSFFLLPCLISNLLKKVSKTLIPGKTITIDDVLHGEQYLEIVNTPPKYGTFINKTKVLEVLDKGSNAVMVSKTESYNEEGALMIINESTTFIFGAGGFGGPRSGVHAKPCFPKPHLFPDASFTYKLSFNQAALYSLLGDVHGLHIDPKYALARGLEKPILHGLCTLGISIRFVLKVFAGYDETLFKSVQARFSKSVFPGDTLRVDLWRDGNRIHFETVIVEKNIPAITNAYVELKSVKMLSSIVHLKSNAVFESLNNLLKVQPEKVKDINAIFFCKITNVGKVLKEWTVDLNTLTVYEGSVKNGKADTTLITSDEDFMDLITGKRSFRKQFMSDKLQVIGNITLAQKFLSLLANVSKL